MPDRDAVPDRDVLTFGETMLRLSPPGRRRLSQADSFEAWVAGSESNVAAALCALGLSATWVSRLPDNPLGHKIEAALRGLGVDVAHVVWTPPQERVGLFYAEPAAEPRAGVVVYDRAHSAASALSPADLPGALFDAHRHLHVSGITPALSASCAAAVADAIARARARGRTVSLDINYRAKLWSPPRRRRRPDALAWLGRRAVLRARRRRPAVRPDRGRRRPRVRPAVPVRRPRRRPDGGGGRRGRV